MRPVVEPHQPFLDGLGEVVRELRTGRSLSQEALGLETGIHRNYIGGIERGERKPSLILILRLSEALGVKPSELLRQAEKRAE